MAIYAVDGPGMRAGAVADITSKGPHANSAWHIYDQAHCPRHRLAWDIDL